MKSHVEVFICKPESAELPSLKWESGVSSAYPSHCPSLPHGYEEHGFETLEPEDSQLFYHVHTVLAQSHPHL